MENAVKAACLEILAGFRENIENGRITSTQDVLTEVTNCMVQVQHLAEPAPPSPSAIQPEAIANILADLQGKMVYFGDALSGLRSQASEDTTKLLEEQKDNTKTIIAAVENVMTNRAPTSTAQSAPANSAPASSAAANSNPATTSSPATSYPATIFFHGGPRTVTIHPPGTPGYQSIIRDDAGDVIIDFRRRQPLRREGAFRGLPDEDDFIRMKLVRGRAQHAKKPPPPVPRWPDLPQDSPCPSRRSCGASDLIARQRQLAEFMETDEYGRVIPPEYASQLEAPGAPAGSASSPSSQDSQEFSSSNVKSRGVLSPPSTTPPSSPSAGRGKKRTRASEDAEASGMQSTPEEEKPAPSVKNEIPETPVSVKRQESDPAEGPAKRRKLRSSGPLKPFVSTRSISRTYSMADVTRGY